MWDIITEFIPVLITTTIGLAEIGIVFGSAALFFKGVGWIVAKAKALIEG